MRAEEATRREEPRRKVRQTKSSKTRKHKEGQHGARWSVAMTNNEQENTGGRISEGREKQHTAKAGCCSDPENLDRHRRAPTPRGRDAAQPGGDAMLIEKEGARTTRRTRPTREGKGERKAAAGDRGVETFPLVGPAATTKKMRSLPLNPPEREDGAEPVELQYKGDLAGAHAAAADGLVGALVVGQ